MKEKVNKLDLAFQQDQNQIQNLEKIMRTSLLENARQKSEVRHPPRIDSRWSREMWATLMPNHPDSLHVQNVNQDAESRRR